MALTVQAAPVNVAQLRQAEAAVDLRDKAASPRDAAALAPPPPVALDTTTAPVAPEVEALQRQVVSSESHAASHARRESPASETAPVQIGVRARIETAGIKDVGAMQNGAQSNK